MAAKKKSTKKAEEPKMVTIQYSPVGFNAEQNNFPLKKKEYNGTSLVSVPLIEGLPMELSFHKGQTMEVTEEQLKQLQAIKVVESDEERKSRKAFINNIPDQYPNTANDEKAEEVKKLLTANDLQFKIYNDRLIIRD